MEELRSTEILDKEIKEDARKKAERILKNAETEIEKIENNRPQKIEKIKTEKEEFYKEKIQRFKNDCESAIPLEKKRKKIQFISSEIEKALNKYFDEIGTSKRLQIISAMLKEFKDTIDNKTLKIKYIGYEKSEIENLINSNFKNVSVEKYYEIKENERQKFDLHNGMIIEDTDEEFRWRACIGEAKKRLLLEQREELMNNLFGGLEIE